jgi:membrane protein
MARLRATIEAFQLSRAGQFVKKVMDDQAPNLASLLAWGTLSALLPLMLGILSLAGIVLRDQARVDAVYNTLRVLIPGDSGPLVEALQAVRAASAEPAGVVAIVLLLFNGSSLFANMESVFDQAYHVEPRNFVMQRVVALVMLVMTTSLLVVSALSASIGGLLGYFSLGSQTDPLILNLSKGALGRAISWSISIFSAFLLFLLIYKVLPNVRQGWRDVLPGTVLSCVLFFAITQVFPLYLSLFPPNHAYALFGVFLVLTFWLYLLGLVFVLGAELNAFLRQPFASTVAEQTTLALQPQPAREAATHSSLAGHVLGFIGLLLAAALLRGQASTNDDECAATTPPSYGGAVRPTT